MKLNVITIDGPAGSGKSTIAKMLSKKLELKYIDTGATYRTLTLLAIENNIDLEDEKAILDIAKKSRIILESNPGNISDYTVVKLNGRDITGDIRSSKVGAAVSIVSSLSAIRKYLVQFQREVAKSGASVIEGRDTGSVVFPNAILKIFLTADIDERVRRRYEQNKQKGQPVDRKKVKEEILKRDEIDSTRKDSPLIIPDDAVIIDGTKLTIDETFNKIEEIYYERIHNKN